MTMVTKPYSPWNFNPDGYQINEQCQCLTIIIIIINFVCFHFAEVKLANINIAIKAKYSILMCSFSFPLFFFQRFLLCHHLSFDRTKWNGTTTCKVKIPTYRESTKIKGASPNDLFQKNSLSFPANNTWNHLCMKSINPLSPNCWNTIEKLLKKVYITHSPIICHGRGEISFLIRALKECNQEGLNWLLPRLRAAF